MTKEQKSFLINKINELDKLTDEHYKYYYSLPVDHTVAEHGRLIDETWGLDNKRAELIKMIREIPDCSDCLP